MIEKFGLFTALTVDGRIAIGIKDENNTTTHLGTWTAEQVEEHIAHVKDLLCIVRLSSPKVSVAFMDKNHFNEMLAQTEALAAMEFKGKYDA